MPRKLPTVDERSKMSEEQLFNDLNPRSQWKPDQLFAENQVKNLNTRMYGKNAEDETYNEFLLRDTLVAYILAKDDMTIEKIEELTLDQMKGYVKEFDQFIKNTSVFAEGLTPQQSDVNASKLGEVFGKAAAKLKDVKIPEIHNETDIQDAFASLSIPACASNAISYALGNFRTRKTYVMKSGQNAFDKSFKENLPEEMKEVTGRSFRTVRGAFEMTVSYLAPGNTPSQKAATRFILENDVTEQLGGKGFLELKNAPQYTGDYDSASDYIYDDNFSLESNMTKEEIDKAATTDIGKDDPLYNKMLHSLENGYNTVAGKNGFKGYMPELDKKLDTVKAEEEAQRVREEQERRVREAEEHKKQVDEQLNALDTADYSDLRNHRVLGKLKDVNGFEHPALVSYYRPDNDTSEMDEVAKEFDEVFGGLYNTQKQLLEENKNVLNDSDPMYNFLRSFTVKNPSTHKSLNLDDLAHETVLTNTDYENRKDTKFRGSSYLNLRRNDEEIELYNKIMKSVLMYSIKKGCELEFTPFVKTAELQENKAFINKGETVGFKLHNGPELRDIETNKRNKQLEEEDKRRRIAEEKRRQEEEKRRIEEEKAQKEYIAQIEKEREERRKRIEEEEKLRKLEEERKEAEEKARQAKELEEKNKAREEWAATHKVNSEQDYPEHLRDEELVEDEELLEQIDRDEKAERKRQQGVIDDINNNVGKQYININEIQKEDAKNAIEDINKTDKKVSDKRKVNVPEGYVDDHGGINKDDAIKLKEVQDELENGNDEKAIHSKEDEAALGISIKTTRKQLSAKHWFGMAGVSSHEMDKLRDATEYVMKLNQKNQAYLNGTYAQFHADHTALMDEAVALMGKAADEYLAEKRGKKHANDPNWKPHTGMGKKRFEAALALSKYAKAYKRQHSLEALGKKGQENKYTSKVFDPDKLEDWVERMKRIGNEKPKTEEEQKKVIKDIKRTAAGMLACKYGHVVDLKENNHYQLEDVMIGENADKFYKSNEFKQMCELNDGKDAWEKAMNVKKLASKNNGDRLFDTHMKLYKGNRRREEEARKKAGENEIVRRDSDLNRGEYRIDTKLPKPPKAGK